MASASGAGLVVEAGVGDTPRPPPPSPFLALSCLVVSVGARSSLPIAAAADGVAVHGRGMLGRGAGRVIGEIARRSCTRVE